MAHDNREMVDTEIDATNAVAVLMQEKHKDLLASEGCLDRSLVESRLTTLRDRIDVLKIMRALMGR